MKNFIMLLGVLFTTLAYADFSVSVGDCYILGDINQKICNKEPLVFYQVISLELDDSITLVQIFKNKNYVNSTVESEVTLKKNFTKWECPVLIAKTEVSRSN